MELQKQLNFSESEFIEIFKAYIMQNRSDLNQYIEQILDGLWELILATELNVKHLIRIVETIQILNQQEFLELDEDCKSNLLYKDDQVFITFE